MWGGGGGGGGGGYMSLLCAIIPTLFPYLSTQKKIADANQELNCNHVIATISINPSLYANHVPMNIIYLSYNTAPRLAPRNK